MVPWRSYFSSFRIADTVAGVGKTILRLLNIVSYLIRKFHYGQLSANTIRECGRCRAGLHLLQL
jgi:hypothetical protein